MWRRGFLTVMEAQLQLLLIGTCVCKQTPVSPLRCLFMLQRLMQTLSTQMTNRSDLLEMSLSPPHPAVQKWESITCLTVCQYYSIFPLLGDVSHPTINIEAFYFMGRKSACCFFFSPHVCLALFSLDQWHKQEEWIYPQLREEA